MNYLITGGCGFIGVNLTRRILDSGQKHRIRIIDNFCVGTREDLASVGEFVEFPDRELAGAPAHNIELVKGDVRDASLAEKVCRGIDAVVHLAANTGIMPSIEDPRMDCMVNVIGVFNYLEAARINGVKRFVFASSGASIGEQIPPIHEKMAASPISPYGAGKLAGEAYCTAYHGSFKIDAAALRFGNVYGRYSSRKGSVAAKFIKNIMAGEPMTIYGDGNQTRDFIYVDDLTEAIRLALIRDGIGGEVFQIATHREHTVLEVARELNRLSEKHLGRSCEINYEKEREGEVRRNYSDITKAKKILGFRPVHDLTEGLEKTFLWFLQQREGRGA